MVQLLDCIDLRKLKEKPVVENFHIDQFTTLKMLKRVVFVKPIARGYHGTFFKKNSIYAKLVMITLTVLATFMINFVSLFLV